VISTDLTGNIKRSRVGGTIIIRCSGDGRWGFAPGINVEQVNDVCGDEAELRLKLSHFQNFSNTRCEDVNSNVRYP
jgi:hypothetical protein